MPNLRPVCWALFFPLFFLGVWVTHAQARVTVRDSQLGFSFEVPVGFKEAGKNVAGQASEDVLYRFALPALRGRPAITIVVERLHAPLARPAGESAADQPVEMWKTFPLPVEQSAGTENSESTVTLQVRVPLAPEAMRISISGPTAQEKRIRTALHVIFNTLDGRTTWTADSSARTTNPAASVTSKPAPAVARLVPANVSPAPAAVPHVQQRLPAALPVAAAPAREPMSWGLIALCVAGGCLVLFRVYRYYRRVAGETRYPGYILLIGCMGGIMLAVVAGRNPFGAAELAALAVCSAAIGFAIWRIVRLARRQTSPAAPANAASKVYDVDYWTTKSDLQVRAFGLLALIIVTAGTYMLVFEPLHRAKTEQPSVLYLQPVVLVLFPFLVAFGLVALVFGKRFVLYAQHRRASRQISWPGLIVLVLLLVTGIALVCWFNAKLRALGYDV